MRKAARHRRGRKIRGGLASIGQSAAKGLGRFWGKAPLNANPVKPRLGEVSKVKGH